LRAAISSGSGFLFCNHVIETNTIRVSVSASIRSSMGKLLPGLVDPLVDYHGCPVNLADRSFGSAL